VYLKPVAPTASRYPGLVAAGLPDPSSQCLAQTHWQRSIIAFARDGQPMKKTGVASATPAAESRCGSTRSTKSSRTTQTPVESHPWHSTQPA